MEHSKKFERNYLKKIQNFFKYFFVSVSVSSHVFHSRKQFPARFATFFFLRFLDIRAWVDRSSGIYEIPYLLLHRRNVAFWTFQVEASWHAIFSKHCKMHAAFFKNVTLYRSTRLSWGPLYSISRRTKALLFHPQFFSQHQSLFEARYSKVPILRLGSFALGASFSRLEMSQWITLFWWRCFNPVNKKNIFQTFFNYLALGLKNSKFSTWGPQEMLKVSVFSCFYFSLCFY